MKTNVRLGMNKVRFSQNLNLNQNFLNQGAYNFRSWLFNVKFSKTPTCVDIFSGAGGMSEGFRQAGFEVLLGVDCDPFSVQTFQRNHGKAIQCRIEKLTANRIRKEVGGRRITVLVAGPPCQAFSTIAVAKLRSLNKSTNLRHPLNKLYREVLRLVKDLQPPFFVMENVGRMFSISDGAIKDEIESEMKRHYRVSFYFDNVKNFGVPQSRKRGVIIGNNLGIPNPVLKQTHYDPREDDTPRGRKPYETVRSAISDLPRITTGKGAEFMKYSTVSSLTRYQKQRRRGSSGVYHHTAREHNQRDLKIFKMLRPGTCIKDLPKRYNPYRKDAFPDRFKKQPWNKPSSTIIAHLSKDGLMHIHPDGRQNRTITARESARLQSFDDTYFFEGPRTKQYIQIGNAVPPLFAKTIARSIMNSLTIKTGNISRRTRR